jgi:serine/threonine protein kinase
MVIQFNCPTCGRKLRAPESAAGKKAKCRGCQSVFEVPISVFKGPDPGPPVVEIDDEAPEYQPEIDEEVESVRKPHPVVAPPHRLQPSPVERVQVETPPAPLVTPPPMAASPSARTGGSIPRDVSTVGGPGAAPVSAEESLVSLAGHPKYKLLGLLGKGGMGTVYKAEHRAMKRLVALKMIAGSLINNAASVKRFEQEIVAAARLSHPNVVTAYDAEEYAGFHFLVMEFVEGVDVGQIVKTGGPLPVVDACDYVRQAAMGLQHAFEQGMVHRDIKPQHLIRTPDGRIKILDFGLARFVSESAPGAGLTESRAIMGTPDYVAPEQLQDSRKADIRADIYGLGCTLYFLLTGQPPFPAGTAFQKYMAHVDRAPQSVAELRKDLPPGLPPIVERMMAKLPALRFQTPMDVAQALVPIINSAASPETQRDKTDKPGALQPSRLVTIPAPPEAFQPEIDERAPADPLPARTRGRVKRKRGSRSSKSIARRIGGLLSEHKIKLVLLALLAGAIILGRSVAYRIEWIYPSGLYPIGEYEPVAGPIKSVAFSGDGEKIVAGGDGGVLNLWNRTSGRRVDFGENPTPISRVAISSDGAYVAAATEGGIGLWEAKVGGQHWRCDASRCNTVAFVLNNQIFCAGSESPAAFVVEKSDGKLVAEPIQGTASQAYEVAIAPGAKYFLLGGQDGKLQLRGVDRVIQTWDSLRGQILACWLSPDGKRALSIGTGGYVCIWDLTNTRAPRPGSFACGASGGTIAAAAFSPDGERMIVADGKVIELWDIAGTKRLADFPVQSRVHCLAFHPNGIEAIAGNDDGVVRRWRLR